MPRIVKSYGVQVTDQVFKIRDVLPEKPKPAPQPGDAGEGEGFVADFPFAEEEGALPAEEYADEEYEHEEAPPRAERPQAPQVQSEIIQGAMAEASRILEEAVRTAEGTRSEILAKAQYEAEKLQREASENGRREGFASVIGEVREVAANVENALARFEGERAGYEAEYEEQLKWFAIEIASKVLAKKVSRDDSELTEMVEKAVHGVHNEPWIRIEVAQEMTSLIQRLRELYDENTKIEVEAVMAKTPDSIHIETPSGVIDASLRTQLENLKGYFEQNNK